MAEDEDVPQLSAETFAALQEFYSEQSRREEIIEQLKSEDKLKENVIFEENWQLSQFWYDEATIKSLVKVIDRILPDGGSVALISCPTLFIPIKRQLGDKGRVKILEFDTRFDVHGSDFIHYDYNTPEKLPPALRRSFDIVIADPPFLSEECITKTSQTVKLLAKDKIIVCTGAVMKERVKELLILEPCAFEPKHRNNLANEFSCYANFDLDSALSR